MLVASQMAMIFFRFISFFRTSNEICPFIISSSSFLGLLQTSLMTNFQLACQLNLLEHCTSITEVRLGAFFWQLCKCDDLLYLFLSYASIHDFMFSKLFETMLKCAKNNLVEWQPWYNLDIYACFTTGGQRSNVRIIVA